MQGIADRLGRPGFDPQALTSLTKWDNMSGSEQLRFDPQALTSLTEIESSFKAFGKVSIHRLLRA